MSTTAMRTLRGVLLLLALGAAVAVFVVGGRDGGTDWQVPALVLIGVVVLIIQAATSTGRPDRAPVVAPVGPSYEERHHLANPHHMAEPSTAEHGGATGAVPLTRPVHTGMTDVVVPAASFPDAGHGHGPVIRVSDDAPPPPLHSVLQPPAPAAPAEPPTPASVPTDVGRTPDPVLLDLRPETDDPMVMRVIAGEPPPPGSRADVSAPDTSSAPEPAASDDADSWMPTSWIPGSTPGPTPPTTPPPESPAAPPAG